MDTRSRWGPAARLPDGACRTSMPCARGWNGARAPWRPRNLASNPPSRKNLLADAAFSFAFHLIHQHIGTLDHFIGRVRGRGERRKSNAESDGPAAMLHCAQQTGLD